MELNGFTVRMLLHSVIYRLIKFTVFLSMPIQVGVIQNAQINLRDDLCSDANLSEEEADALATKLMENLAAAEALIGQEAVRQSMVGSLCVGK